MADLDLKVERVKASELKVSERNARVHSKSQIEQIKRSIERFGFVQPILIDETGEIIAGHGRFEALRALRRKEVDVIRLDHLSEADKRALAIVDNQIPLNASWDVNRLKEEYEFLLGHSDFKIDSFGFDSIFPASTFIDDIAEEEGPSPLDKASSGERSDFVILQFSLSHDQRALVVSWLKGLCSKHGYQTTGDALVALAQKKGKS